MTLLLLLLWGLLLIEFCLFNCGILGLLLSYEKLVILLMVLMLFDLTLLNVIIGLLAVLGLLKVCVDVDG